MTGGGGGRRVKKAANMKTGWRWLPVAVAVMALSWPGTVRVEASAGLRATYFRDTGFQEPVAERIDPGVDFDWGLGAPMAGLDAGGFAVRWEGRVLPVESGRHVFRVHAEGGVRLWLDGRLAAMRLVGEASAWPVEAETVLSAGRAVDVRLEFVETGGPASVRLTWEQPGQPEEVIPAERLWAEPSATVAGSVLAEYWTGLAAGGWGAWTNLTTYPDRPGGRERFPRLESWLTNWTDHYAVRIRGWLEAPEDGLYRFAVAGDERVELWLGIDGSPERARRIAWTSEPTGFREWTRSDSQVSAPGRLAAGRRYYVEVRFLEETGADHFSVGWQLPGREGFEVIDGRYWIDWDSDRAVPGAEALLATLATGRPRLLASRMRFDWLARELAVHPDGQPAQWFEKLRQRAEGMLDDPVSTYDPDERGTILGTSRRVLDRAYTLGLAYRMTGDGRYAERLWAELEAAAAFPDWHPAHFLDTAEMTHAFAVAYDWLYDRWTAGQRALLRGAILGKGLNVGLQAYKDNVWWSRPTANNWNLVCNGGLAMGALALGEEGGPTAREVLRRAVLSAAEVVRHWTADNGGWYEGPGYWGYTINYNARLCAGLEGALGSDFGLAATPGFRQSGRFALHMPGPTDLSFNFADAHARAMRSPTLFWLARRFAAPAYAAHQRDHAAREALDLLWYVDAAEAPPAGEPPRDIAFLGPTGTAPYAPAEVATLRSGWDSEALFVGFKGGDLGASHGHLDAGTLVLDALGRRWLVDLGGDSYALPSYFGSKRWTYYRLRAEGHNTLVIGAGSDPDQRVGAHAPLIAFESREDRAWAIADLTPAYVDARRLWRGVMLFNGRRDALVQDEIELAGPRDTWSFLHLNTGVEVQLASDGRRALLTAGGDRLWAEIVSAEGRWEVLPAAPLPGSPNPAGQNPNEGYRKLAMHLPALEHATLAVWLHPLLPGEPPPVEPPALRPLDRWHEPEDRPPVAGTLRRAVRPGGVTTIDLRTLVEDDLTPPERWYFRLGAVSGGSARLEADGHTLRCEAPASAGGVMRVEYVVTDAAPGPANVLWYDFEDSDSLAAGLAVDAGGRAHPGLVETVGEGAFRAIGAGPEALALWSRGALELEENGPADAARLRPLMAPGQVRWNEQDWTVAGWFRRNTVATHDFVFYLGRSDGFGDAHELTLYGPQHSNSLVLRNDPGPDVELKADGVTAGSWRHAAVVRAGDELRLYVDGRLRGIDRDFELALPEDAGLVFGGHQSATFKPDRWFGGALDDLAVWGRALSPAEVFSLSQMPPVFLNGHAVTGLVEVVITSTNTPPGVRVTAPADGAVLRAPAEIALAAEVEDWDGDVATVAWQAGGAWLGETAPGESWALSGVWPGRYVLRAVARDAGGLMSTSAPVTVTVTAGLWRVISEGASWRYWDREEPPPAGWTRPDFDDAAWPRGAAELGFGDGDETTVLAGRGGRTCWFRREWVLPPLPELRRVLLRLKRDDGAIVYVNGREAFRSNMPEGPVGPDTPAMVAVEGGAENAWEGRWLLPAWLQVGANVIAVEVHQAVGGAEDLSFDLSLDVEVSSGPPKLVWTREGDALDLRWPAGALDQRLWTAREPGPTADWQPWPSHPELREGWREVRVTPADRTLFFRLSNE
ncbi:MAG: hypothetical protein D6766_06620 [Verrucomicrobia bacterium]|nr:MAG: hypothetical protein D6766_06620 [Verrucomicrobiota bacterium]